MTPNDIEKGEKARLDREESNYQTLADVKWSDLDFFVAKARRMKDPAAFDIAIRVLTTLKKQVTGK